MDTTFDHLKMKDELIQSKMFGSEYKEILQAPKINAFSNSYVDDVEDVINGILVQYDSLTDYQKVALNSLFDEFNYIREVIDPNRLKKFRHSINSDNELLIYRKTDEGLINIIVNPEECTAFSFISKDDNKKDVLRFYYETSDFQNLTLEFFSRG